MTTQYVTYDLEGQVALIGLDRTEKRNAISMELLAQFRQATIRAGEEADAAVIYAHGDHFCGGLDLAEVVRTMEAGAPPPPKRRRRLSHDTLDIVARGPIPFVSALQGAVVGFGLEIAASVHIRVADETAFFGLPEGQRGIFVGAGGSVRVQRIIGYARMADMMLTGRLLNAVEAERIGLVQYLVAPGQALAKAKEIATKITTNAPMSNWAITNMLPRMADLSYNDGLFMEELAQANVRGPGSLDRLKAFVEKRATPLRAPPTAGPPAAD
jgi:(methylthio)acryloyl-CoA hydratase